MPIAKKKARKVEAPVVRKTEEAPDVVRVRATKEGFYGNLLRNPGDVFLMETAVMEPVPSDESLKELEPKDRKAQQQRIDTYEHIETAQGTFLLPSWVECVDEDEALTTPSGHQTIVASTPPGHPTTVPGEKSKSVL
jgi:hypothetical protein